jgi:iron complex transport system ATP-binding protein
MDSDLSCINIKDISLEHSGAIVCENLNLIIHNDSLTLFTGRNPACWRVLMRMISGLQPISAGAIELWGVPVQRISRRALNSQVCFVPRQQHPSFAYPVIDYVLQGLEPNLKPLQARPRRIVKRPVIF